MQCPCVFIWVIAHVQKEGKKWLRVTAHVPISGVYHLNAMRGCARLYGILILEILRQYMHQIDLFSKLNT